MSGTINVFGKPDNADCLLRGFGEHSVKLQLRFWIEDPSNGVGNVRTGFVRGQGDSHRTAHPEGGTHQGAGGSVGGASPAASR